jgi:hypothetical protein
MEKSKYLPVNNDVFVVTPKVKYIHGRKLISCTLLTISSQQNC